jgi:acyl-CoA synthetase (AMP-forming)/AMP-acid ligase II
MDTLGDAIARDRRSDRPALSVPRSGRTCDYRRFCTSAWKTGNFLRYLGVRRGSIVAIADDPTVEPIVTLYGAAELGAVVTFGPDATVEERVRALVVPATVVDDHEVGPSTKRVVYGEPPDDPSISYFERDIWSENPTAPPDRVDPDDPLLETDTDRYTHRELLTAAQSVIDEHDLDAGDSVAVVGSFADPGVVAAGLIAPIVAGARMVVGESAADLVVGGDDSDVAVGSIEALEATR